MKAPTLLIACGLVLLSSMLMRASSAGHGRERYRAAAASPASRSRAVCSRSSTAASTVWSGNGRACADCHMAADHFQLSPADVEARFQLLQRQARAASECRRPAVSADRRGRLPDQRRQRQRFQQPSPERPGQDHLPAAVEHEARSIPRPTRRRPRRSWTSGGACRRSTTSRSPDPTTINPWTRGPNDFGGYQLDARVATLQEQALGALTNHAQIQQAPPQRLLDDLSSFQRVLFTNHRVRALSDAVREGTTPLPDPDPPAQRARTAGKGRVRSAPAASATAAPDNRPHRRRSFDFTTSRASVRVPSTRRRRPALPLPPCPPQLARNARTYEIACANGTKIRRTSSDPGRALLTGFVGGVPAQDDWNKFDVPGLRGISKTAPYFHNNSAATPRRRGRPLHRVLQARAGECARRDVVPPIASTDGVHFDRQPTPEERAALLAYLRKL